MDVNEVIASCTFGVDYCRTLYSLISTRKFIRGLEVGYDSGSSAAMFKVAHLDTPLTSIDVADCPVAEALLQKFGLKKNHTFLKGDSTEILPRMIKNGVTFDYIYVDGDHLYNAVSQDIYNCSKLLQLGGLMIIDDANPNNKHWGIHDALMEFLKNNPDWIATSIVGNPNGAVILTRKQGV